MLSNAMVEEVRRLLAEGKLSQRDISKQTGISRGTITAISMNRRNERQPRPEEPDTDQGPPARCRTCGGMVYLPCRLCRVRDAKFGPEHDRPLGASLRRQSSCGPSTRFAANEPRANPERSSTRSFQDRPTHDFPRLDRAARLPGR